MVGVAIPTLRELRSAVLASSEADAAVAALREAGYAGGDSVLAAFEQWLGETGSEPVDRADSRDLQMDEFRERASDFFRNAGWGELTFSDDESEGVASVTIDGCWEAGDASTHTGCHITTGMLAAFFGQIAGYPVAVLETHCGSDDGSACQFLIGNTEMMNYKWEEMR
jgi:predicted hydrocarbon binding protein